ncbi:MAG: porphobilinogen synthase [Cetobacterium sp.]|uniref:porphobilinogen synthase n=1 Tax=unclassified Cetobacterium TaxID=2630983 RepID=UPI00163CFEF1|nr:porphobilinogen synthase [Cetobacterium sp. 2A]MBC2856250.1 porphobilinogen synthase [Cetobacterium sp. 2A]
MFNRTRRTRTSQTMRDLVSNVTFSLDNLVYPLFIEEGNGIKTEISSMPGQYRFSIDMLKPELQELKDLGIRSLLLFGIPAQKDEIGSEAYNNNGIVQQALRFIKNEFPDFLIVTDVCMCEYTSHGHCGILEGDQVLNDPTVKLLEKIAISHAKAGADIIAPSDMMDGRIGAIRKALDEAGFHHTPIMSYSVKYSSSYYGPFREAADSAPSFGDRKAYQMDFRNSRDYILEARNDVAEGADIIMVKPGMPYLDVVKSIADVIDLPIAVYNVSGEYSMVKAAAEKGWLDEEKVVLENMYAMRRAGASIIITYHAKDIAKWRVN